MGFPTNTDRAGWAEDALCTFEAETGSDRCDSVSDMLADLMHFCDRNEDEAGSFAENVRRAETHYLAEVEEDEP